MSNETIQDEFFLRDNTAEYDKNMMSTLIRKVTSLEMKQEQDKISKLFPL